MSLRDLPDMEALEDAGLLDRPSMTEANPSIGEDDES